MNYILAGEICSGKDEVAMLLHGTRFAFAEDFKIVCRLLRTHDISVAHRMFLELFQGHEPHDLQSKLRMFEKYPVELGKDRHLYQDIGMWSRESYPDIWVDAVKRKVARCETPVIITDCRFHNELLAFPTFASIYVEASEAIRMQRMILRDGEIKPGSLGHPAEQEIQSLRELCWYQLMNEGSREELQRNIDIMMMD